MPKRTAHGFELALVLYGLHAQVGDKKFFQILRTFAERFRHGNASTEQFVSLAMEISQTDQAPYFQRSLYGVHLPQFPPSDARTGQ